MAAQGYVQAQERFYEMDVRRHTTAGRLSELFGPDTLEIDEFVRTLGWRRVAEQELPLLEPETRAALEAYAVGVNAYLDDRTPVGDRRAVHRPRARRSRLPPRAVDRCRLAGLAQGDGLGPQGQHRRGDRAGAGLRRPHAGAGRRAVPGVRLRRPTPRSSASGAVVDGVFEPDAEEGGTRNPERPAFTADQRAQLAGLHRTLERLPSFVGRGDGVGSNSWVVDGEHSATGQPLLANDPHLGVSMPGIWMQMGLHCTTVAQRLPAGRRGLHVLRRARA